MGASTLEGKMRKRCLLKQFLSFGRYNTGKAFDMLVTVTLSLTKSFMTVVLRTTVLCGLFLQQERGCHGRGHSWQRSRFYRFCKYVARRKSFEKIRCSSRKLERKSVACERN